MLLDDVATLPRVYAPAERFTLTVKRDGDVVQAVGPVAGRKLALCYPGASTWSDVLNAEDAMTSAGLSRGLTPPGRAYDLALRTNPKVRQWRVRAVYMRAFRAALYGGLQYGGAIKPDMSRPPIGRGMGWYHADIASSYPYLALDVLPTVASGCFHRGMRRNATLWYVEPCEQDGRHLWRRDQFGAPVFDDCIAGWYVREEIEQLADMGAIARRALRVSGSIVFAQGERYLAPLVERLYDAKERERARGDVRSLPIKVALNGLVGRFAARMSPWRQRKDGDAPGRATWLHLGRNVLVWDKQLANLYPSGANGVWTAIVTARGRMRLREKIREIERVGGVVEWAHTDAVIAAVPDSYSPVDGGRALGAWRIITRTYSRGKDHDQQAA